jgi:Peptidase family S41
MSGELCLTYDESRLRWLVPLGDSASSRQRNRPIITRIISLALALLCIVPAASASLGEDLSEIYPADKTWSEFGLFPQCSAEDVWELKSFEFDFGKELSISCKQAKVAFGVDGSNVIWAAVFPDKPAKIKSSGPGNGESAKTIFLRFQPSEIEQIFPAKTVLKRGEPWLRAEAHRMAGKKVVWRWCTGRGNPTIVPAGWCLIDVDTIGGPRRFWGVDRNTKQLHYESKFEKKPLPPPTPIDEKGALVAFDEVWRAFDVEYPGFVELPEVDWKMLRKQYRAHAADVRDTYMLGAVIADMLAQLQDLHVWVKAGDDWLPGYTRERPLNGSWKATQTIVKATHQEGKQLVWGLTEDNLGYIGVHGLGDADLPKQFDAALEALRDTSGLIIDLRFNGGGDEMLAREMVGRLLDEERVYALSQYRNGPGHDALGPKYERKFVPRGPWRYEESVVALWGRKTLSSAESMAMMLDQCPQVTTMGDWTGGSSANPRRLELDCGITVNLPRWLDMDTEGKPIERVGVKPEVLVEAGPKSFNDRSDPVIAAAIKHLVDKP